MGSLLAVQTVGSLLSGPIAGALYDIHQSFTPMIIYSSLTMLLGAFFVDLASKSVSVVTVSNPHDFNHRQGSFRAVTKNSSERMLIEKSMSFRLPAAVESESSDEVSTQEVSRMHFSIVHYLWSIQSGWTRSVTGLPSQPMNIIKVANNEIENENEKY